MIAIGIPTVVTKPVLRDKRSIGRCPISSVATFRFHFISFFFFATKCKAARLKMGDRSMTEISHTIYEKLENIGFNVVIGLCWRFRKKILQSPTRTRSQGWSVYARDFVQNHNKVYQPRTRSGSRSVDARHFISNSLHFFGNPLKRVFGLFPRSRAKIFTIFSENLWKKRGDLSTPEIVPPNILQFSLTKSSRMVIGRCSISVATFRFRFIPFYFVATKSNCIRLKMGDQSTTEFSNTIYTKLVGDRVERCDRSVFKIS